MVNFILLVIFIIDYSNKYNQICLFFYSFIIIYFFMAIFGLYLQ